MGGRAGRGPGEGERGGGWTPSPVPPTMLQEAGRNTNHSRKAPLVFTLSERDFGSLERATTAKALHTHPTTPIARCAATQKPSHSRLPRATDSSRRRTAPTVPSPCHDNGQAHPTQPTSPILQAPHQAPSSALRLRAAAQGRVRARARADDAVATPRRRRRWARGRGGYRDTGPAPGRMQQCAHRALAVGGRGARRRRGAQCSRAVQVLGMCGVCRFIYLASWIAGQVSAAHMNNGDWHAC